MDHQCDFRPHMTITRASQAGFLGTDGGAMDVSVEHVAENVVYRCRYCLREVKVKDVPKDGLPVLEIHGGVLT